jgi:hypothetical protein
MKVHFQSFDLVKIKKLNTQVSFALIISEINIFKRKVI